MATKRKRRRIPFRWQPIKAAPTIDLGLCQVRGRSYGANNKRTDDWVPAGAWRITGTASSKDGELIRLETCGQVWWVLDETLGELI